MAPAASASVGETHELVVVGGGLVGVSLAIACAQAGLDTLVVDREDPSVMLAAGYDGRASAIAYGSRPILAGAGGWGERRPGGAPPPGKPAAGPHPPPLPPPPPPHG